MFGYNGKVLRVDLTERRVKKEKLEREDIIKFIGGRGFGILFLFRELEPHIDPLSEKNKILFLTGPLTGTPFQAVSRFLVCTKSPLTGAYARSSAGGDFGAWLKFSGYDFIIVEGSSEEPLYLFISPETVELRSAKEIWGKRTGETQRILKGIHGEDVRITCIGPAGENLVRYAACVTGKRTASRCGVGTVMGSKKLKAIVIKAKRKSLPEIYDRDLLKSLIKEQFSMIFSNSQYKKHKKYGTTDGATTRNLLGVYPTRNFRFGQMKDYERLSEEEYMKLRVGEFGCYSCSARCGKIHLVPEGRPYAGARSEGPEYESYWSFSGPIDAPSIEATIKADELCDEYGLDSISTGGTIGFAFELYERGIITKKDTDGLELVYGNHGAFIELIEKIAKREGFGNILAEGTKRAASLIGKGAERYAMQVKGLEIAGYEPRGLKATGFGYATSNIGGSHSNGSLAFQEWGMPIPRAVNRFEEEGKADIVIYNQHNSALGETGIVCAFAHAWGEWYRKLYPEMLFSITGIEEFRDWAYLRKVGERIWNLDRVFNVREGFSRKDDTLPSRFLEEPLHTIDAEGEGEMIRSLDRFLDEYYELRGWTKEGIPTKEKLMELDLESLLKDFGD